MDDYIDLGLNKILPLLNGAEGITASAWVKVNSYNVSDSAFLFNEAINVSSIACGMYITTDHYFRMGGRSKSNDLIQDTLSISKIELGKWYHLVGVNDYKNKKIEVYINGVLDNEISGVGFSSDYLVAGIPTINAKIGGHSTAGRMFDGMIDEILIYSTSLNLSQIQSQYYAGLTNLLTKGLITEEEYQERLAIN